MAEKNADTKSSSKALERVRKRKATLVSILKKQGIYSAEMYMQATLASQLMERTEQLFKEIAKDGHSPVMSTSSREGAAREHINVLEKLYLDYVDRTQRAIKALGANTDSKARKTEDADVYSSFMKGMEEDSD